MAADAIGVSGRAMIEALIAGERDPAVLADLAKGVLRKEIPDLTLALAGRFAAHHGLLCALHLRHLDHLNDMIGTLDTQIDAEGDPRAEQWVRDQARNILAGRAGIVAAAIRRKATYHGLDPGQRRNADTAAAYLLAKKPYLDYPTALHNGWPIATGVIEGACRHLVKDRMDITGARWGLPGAEAILKLRALISNGDFDQYWTWHLAQEQQRIHNNRYLDGVIPIE